MIELIGRLHPLLVHLPIGILLLAILFEWLPSKKKYRSLKRSINTILATGSVTGFFSCFTGYLLSQSGEYESSLVSWHQWLGITLAVYSFGYVLIRNRKGYKSFRKSLSTGLLIILVFTGHLGGSLTHGEDYLTASFTSTSSFDVAKVNLPEAIFYDDLVKPILENKCYGCHGPSKQKGKLRLDEPQRILKGGKDGAVIVAGKPDESELIDRILLLSDDEDHMPPKEKKQLSEKEIEILKTWIAAGADFKKSATQSGQLETLQKIISGTSLNKISIIPEREVSPADEEVLSQLHKLGVVILPVAANSNYLSANLINATSLDSTLDLLVKVKEQLIWLKAAGSPLTDNHLEKIALLTNLTRLNVDDTKITDAGLNDLKLEKLEYLNLNNTKITSSGIAHLVAIKHLHSLYLYGTNIKSEEVESIKKLFPNVMIEIGNYQVPLIPFDTIEAKAPAVK